MSFPSDTASVEVCNYISVINRRKLTEVKYDIDEEGRAECPDCGQRIKLGPSGLQNLKIRHMGSETCKAAKSKRDKNRTKKKDGSLFAFFKQPKPALNPPTLKASPLIHPTLEAQLNLGIPEALNATAAPPESPASAPAAAEGALLQRLHFISQNLANDVLEATENDVLALFGEDPASFDSPDINSEDLWEEILNPVMKGILGWGDEVDAASVVRRGERGMSALFRFVRYFILQRGVDERLFEGKLSKLLDAAERWLALQQLMRIT